jgi:cystathionine gamma-synthase
MRLIKKLASICEQKFGVGDERCMLFPSNTYAIACRDFLERVDPSSSPRIVQFFICPENASAKAGNDAGMAITSRCGDLHIVLFGSSYWKHSKAFWQHTGTGISSRFADHCLRLLAAQNAKAKSSPEEPPKSPVRGRNRHYFSRSKGQDQAAVYIEAEDEITDDYLEERYARNLPSNAAVEAKRSLKARIAGVCMRDDTASLEAAASPNDVGIRARGVPNVSEDDVFLFQGGMCAIWHSHQLLLKTLGSRKSICWGFVVTRLLSISF